MLEWNTFIKPLVYVVELIFATVVSVGTADRLLFNDSNTGNIRCALNDSVPACAAVISFGFLCIFGSFYILWKRLSSVFLCDCKYSHTAESAMCFLLTLGWLSISSVITANSARPPDVAREFLRTERTVTITFAWLLVFFHIGSVAIAWFAPDEDYLEEGSPSFLGDSVAFEYHPAFAQPHPHYTASSPALPTQLIPDPPQGSESAPELSDPQLADITPFLEQQDQVEPQIQSSQFVETPLSIAGPSPPVGPRIDEVRLREPIENLASTWKQIVSADLEADTPHVDISLSLQPSAQNESAEISSTMLISEASAPQSALRRRAVRFFESSPEARGQGSSEVGDSEQHRSA